MSDVCARGHEKRTRAQDTRGRSPIHSLPDRLTNEKHNGAKNALDKAPHISTSSHECDAKQNLQKRAQHDGHEQGGERQLAIDPTPQRAQGGPLLGRITPEGPHERGVRG